MKFWSPAFAQPAVLFACLLPALANATQASVDPLRLMREVESRQDSGRVRAELHFVLADDRGREQTRKAIAYRVSDAEAQRQAIYLTHPRHLAGSALLTWRDPVGARADDQWLYLPALKRSRRVPSADQRQPFLGTDLSLGDMRALAKVNTREFRFLSAEAVPGAPDHWLVTGEPVDAATANNIGYGRSRWRVDSLRQLVLEAEHENPEGEPFKHVRFDDIERIDGVWTPRSVKVRNLKTGTRTELSFERIETDARFEMSVLTEAGLARGP